MSITQPFITHMCANVNVSVVCHGIDLKFGVSLRRMPGCRLRVAMCML